MSRIKNNVRITGEELELLNVIDRLGPCTSDKVHEQLDNKSDYLMVMRALHGLAEKGFLQRMIINKKQLYKTSRHYNFVKSFLENS